MRGESQRSGERTERMKDMRGEDRGVIDVKTDVIGEGHKVERGLKKGRIRTERWRED